MSELLKVQNLSAYYLIEETGEMRRAVDNVSFAIDTGEVFGVTGRSGSGKTTLARSLVGAVTSYPGVINLELTFDGGCIVAPKTEREEGAILINGFNSRAFRKWQRKKYQKPIETLRGKGSFMVFQEPRDALNPNLPIGKQIAECLENPDGDPDKIKKQVTELLEAVKLSEEEQNGKKRNPEEYLKMFPHELSIGMCQRVVIAMALALKPRLIIADEPTTKLDQMTQKEIVELLEKLKTPQKDWQLTMLLITHQLGVINALADRVAVMYEGKFVEVGQTRQVFSHPKHPYTQMLVESYQSTDVRLDLDGEWR